MSSPLLCAAERAGAAGDRDRQSSVLRELTVEAAHALVELAGHGSQSPLLSVELRQLGGALGRREPGHGALAAIEGEYVLYGVGVPETPEVGQAVNEHLAAIVERLRPWATGTSYANFADRPIDDISTAFDHDAHHRLRALKQGIDPDDLLHANHPIEPAR